MQIEELKTAIDEYQGVTALGITELKARLDAIEASAGRLNGGGTELTAASNEHHKAFVAWARRGHGESDLLGLQGALEIGSDPDGGFAVPTEIDSDIEKLLLDISPIRAISRVVQVGTSDYKKLVNTGGMASGWVGEKSARPETDTPTFAEIAPPIGEIYANPSATQQSLDDIFFNVDEFLSEDIADEFSLQEGTAFVNGNGINKPRGFLTYAISATADDTREFGELEHLAPGVSGGFPASDPSDILVDLVHKLRRGYRRGANWVMNSNSLSVIRKFKDADGRFIWQESLQDDQPGRLLGFPVEEVEDMPDIAANSLSIGFGNFKRGYVVIDRMGTRVLRDPYTNKPYVHFYTTKRVGGGVVNSQAIKLLKFSA